jgi:hypothetical protein
MSPGTRVLDLARSADRSSSLGRPRRDAASFFLDAVSNSAGELLVASPYWSSPNSFVRALIEASIWTRRFPSTTVVVSRAATARRVLADLEQFLPWRPLIYVCPRLHAKVAIREVGGRIKILVGSANLTTAAEHQLEAMVALDVAGDALVGSILALRDAVIASSKRFSDRLDGCLRRPMPL